MSAKVKIYLKGLVYSYKQHFIKKFNWLKTKQLPEILSLQKSNRKKWKNAKDSRRYKARKKRLHKEIDNKKMESMVLNKSSFDLDRTQKSLLTRGFNFAPTPKWSNSVEEKEWSNLISHLRRCKWNNILSFCKLLPFSRGVTLTW